jgi:hypothetical protein
LKPGNCPGDINAIYSDSLVFLSRINGLTDPRLIVSDCFIPITVKCGGETFRPPQQGGLMEVLRDCGYPICAQFSLWGAPRRIFSLMIAADLYLKILDFQNSRTL